jgi:hypothetical protein
MVATISRAQLDAIGEAEDGRKLGDWRHLRTFDNSGGDVVEVKEELAAWQDSVMSKEKIFGRILPKIMIFR